MGKALDAFDPAPGNDHAADVLTVAQILVALAVGSADRVFHGNLDHGNVLADREPSLAIAPTPLNGNPHYKRAPMLWRRWDELDGNVRSGVERRFYTLVDAAGLDEDRARAWIGVRVVREATRARPRNVDPWVLTR